MFLFVANTRRRATRLYVFDLFLMFVLTRACPHAYTQTIRSKLLESRSINNDDDVNEEEEEFFAFYLVQINDNNNNKATNSTKLTTANAVDVMLNKKTTKELRVLFRAAIKPKLVLMNVSFIKINKNKK